MEKEFIAIMEEILEKDEGTVQLDDIFRDYEEWDSLAYISLLAAIDVSYDLTIPIEEFRELKKVKEIINYIKKNK